MSLGQLLPRLSPALRAHPLCRYTIHPSVSANLFCWSAMPEYPMRANTAGRLRTVWRSAQRHKRGEPGAARFGGQPRSWVLWRRESRVSACRR